MAKPDPNKNEDMMPKGMGEVARKMLEQGKKEAKDAKSAPPAPSAPAPKFAKGGGIESKGKTKGKVVKMARGGGIESRGKTRGKFV
jgi:hypothetical protein